MPEPQCLRQLENIGITWMDAVNLRKISMTLHRWHEIWDVYVCHAIGSFDQVVRGRNALTRFAAPSYTYATLYAQAQ